jgi:hypothetical protein
MRKVLFLVLTLIACGGGQQQTTTNNAVDLAKPDAASVAMPNKAVQPLGIPHGAPFVATFDVTAFNNIVPLRQELARELDVDEGALLAQAASFGLDTKRPVTLAVGPLDDNEAKTVTDLQAQFKDASVMPTDETIQKLVKIQSPLVIRILVPTTNSEKLEQTIGKFLQSEHYKKSANGWSKRGDFITFDDDGQSVAVDVVVAHEKAEHLKALREFEATAHDPVPSLDGRTARASWSPQAMAAIGYLTGVIRAVSAVAGESVDPSQKMRILREGFTEASMNFAVANFDKVEMEGRLAPFEFVARAKPSASFVMPPADAFAESLGVSYAQGVAVAQASRAFLKGWPFPGGSMTKGIEMMRDGGGGAFIAGLPHLLAMLPAIESRRSRDAAAFDLGRFERVATVYGQSREDDFISVMPAGTKKADAECAFAPKTPCDAKSKLKLNTVVKVGDLSAKLYEVVVQGQDKRFVVVSSDDDSAKLDAPKLVPSAGMRLEIDTGIARSVLAPNTLPGKISGDVTNENGTLVFRAK